MSTTNGTPEDKREAVNIGINLSNQLVSTALALVAVVGAAVTFIMQQNNVGFWFYLFAIFAFFSLLISIYCGGRGINTARNKGFRGNWDIANGMKWFDWQAKSMIIGVISLCCLFFTNSNKEDEIEKTLKTTNNLILKNLATTNKALQELSISRNNEIKILNSKINDLEKRVNKNLNKKEKHFHIKTKKNHCSINACICRPCNIDSIK